MKDTNNTSEISVSPQQSRREFMRKAMYASPVLLTLPASPSFAQQGSGAVVGDPGGGDPGTDPCLPTEPVGGGQVEMCQLTFDPDTGAFGFEDILVPESEVEQNLALGNLVGTCNSIICSGS